MSLKKMAVSSAKFNILFSWPPISTPLILLLTSMKIASTSVERIYTILRVDTPDKPFA